MSTPTETTAPAGSEASEQANREKHVVALSSVVAAIFLTGMKLVIGIATGSLGILSEAAHSGLDLVAAAFTLVAVRISGKPADNQHTYGHGKVENLSALFETLLLLATCVWIIYEAIQRLFYKEVEVELSIWAFAVVIVAIVIDWTRSRALKRVADKYNSQALEADALHFSTDIWSSFVVLAGLFCVLAAKIFNIAWLAKADAVAALGVSVIVIYVSVKLGNRTISALLDGVPAGVRDEIVAAVMLPGVKRVDRVRVRRSGPEAFADICLAVDRDTSLLRAHDIASAAEEAARKVLPGADVMVHIDPENMDHEDTVTTVQVMAGRHGLGAHGIRVYNIGGSQEMELHLEVKETLSLAEAHAQASRFEQELRTAFPVLKSIVTHIEPTGDGVVTRAAVKTNDVAIVATIRALPASLGVNCRPHSINVRRVGQEMTVSFHCFLDPDASVADVHTFTERAEQALRAILPDLGRVVIHTEPFNGSLTKNSESV
jgi:cation diffusion facilitator family transporter